MGGLRRVPWPSVSAAMPCDIPMPAPSAWAWHPVDNSTSLIKLDTTLVGAVGLASILTVLLVRFGLLSVFAYLSSAFCYDLPVTLRGDAWYAVHGHAVAVLVLGVAVVAYRIACAGQSLLKDDLSPS